MYMYLYVYTNEGEKKERESVLIPRKEIISSKNE